MLTRCSELTNPLGLSRLGAWLNGAGYTARAVSQSLGIIAWNGPALDGTWWRRKNYAEGRLGQLVELLIRGGGTPTAAAHQDFPVDAWASGVLEDHDGQTRASGTVLPLEADLIWTDRADRAFVGDDGIFLPDSTTLALRRCIPPTPVARHLDLGAGGGAVAVRAARWAAETVAVDLNPRAGDACLRSAALSGVTIAPWTGYAEEATSMGRFDRISFVLPLLMPWDGQGSGPVHTISATSDLLARLIEVLPALTTEGALVLLYCQGWVGGAPLPDVLDRAFGARAWRGVFWWDYEGSTSIGSLRAGVLALQLDRGRGWREVPCDAPDMDEDWWTPLSRILEL